MTNVVPAACAAGATILIFCVILPANYLRRFS